MTTPTETLIKALRILANDIQSKDGVANTAILEAAQRMEEDQEVIFQAGESIKILRQTVKHRNKKIEQLVEAGDALHSIGAKIVHQGGEDMYWIRKLEEYLPEWKEAKETKP